MIGNHVTFCKPAFWTKEFPYQLIDIRLQSIEYRLRSDICITIQIKRLMFMCMPNWGNSHRNILWFCWGRFGFESNLSDCFPQNVVIQISTCKKDCGIREIVNFCSRKNYKEFHVHVLLFLKLLTTHTCCNIDMAALKYLPT